MTRASRADRAAPSMDLKKRLVCRAVMPKRAAPTASPHTAAHRASRTVPPKNRQKKLVPTT